MDVTLTGDTVGLPFVSRLARMYSIDVSILGGSIEQVGGARVGRVRIELPGDAGTNAAQLASLRDAGLTLEVHAGSVLEGAR